MTIDAAIALLDAKNAAFKKRRARDAHVIRAYDDIMSQLRDMPSVPLVNIRLVTDDRSWMVGDFPVITSGLRLLDWGKPTEAAHDVAMRFALKLVDEKLIGDDE